MKQHKLVFKRSKTKLASLAIFYNTGSQYETFEERGLSHLAEHVICESYKDIEQAMTARGIVCNAWTWDTHTCFHLTGLDDELRNFALPYIERITSYKDKIDFAVVQREAGIIKQEYEDAFNDASHTAIANFESRYINEHGAIAGITNVINITEEKFNAFVKRAFATPAHVVYTGRKTSKTNPKELPLSLTFDAPTTKKVVNDQFYIATKEVNPASVTSFVTSKDKHTFAESEYGTLAIALLCLTDGLCSPMYKVIREEKQLCYYIRGLASHNIVKGFNYAFMVGCSLENSPKVFDAIKEITSNPEAYVTRQWFDDVKTSVDISRQMKDATNHGIMGVMSKIYQKEKNFDLAPITYEAVIDIIKKMRIDVLETDESLQNKEGSTDIP